MSISFAFIAVLISATSTMLAAQAACPVGVNFPPSSSVLIATLEIMTVNSFSTTKTFPMSWRLRPDAAPLSVGNFLDLVRQGFYNQSWFYRYEPGFVLQGGGDQYFNDSGVSNRMVPLEYCLPNLNMSVGLARGSALNSGSSEFFINLGNNSQRLGPRGSTQDGYTVFATVVGTSDSLAAMQAMEQHSTRPVQSDNRTFHVFGSPQPQIHSITIENLTNPYCTQAVQVRQIPTPLLPRVFLYTKYSDLPMVWQLRPDVAPKTVANFLRLLNVGFYNHSNIYRYEPNWVFQGGSDEFHNEQDNVTVPLEYCLPNVNLSVGLSRLNASASSGSSEYFININNNVVALEPGGKTKYGYTVFAQLLYGVDVLNQWTEIPTVPFPPGVAKAKYHQYVKPYPKIDYVLYCDDINVAVDKLTTICNRTSNHAPSQKKRQHSVLRLVGMTSLILMCIAAMSLALYYHRRAAGKREAMKEEQGMEGGAPLYENDNDYSRM